MQKKEIIVSGTSHTSIPEEVIKILAEEEIELLVASKTTQHVIETYVERCTIKKVISFTPIDDCCKNIASSSQNGRVVVLTSGDPLFFGFGSTIKRRLPAQKIIFIPFISSMQYCFSKFGISWEHARFLSLHGRSLHSVDQSLHEKTLFLFTDKNNSPDRIATHLIEKIDTEMQDDYRFYIGQRLGQKDEKLISGNLEKISGMRFKQPNCVIITNQKNIKSRFPSIFGLKESEIDHSRGLITKNEVRAAVIHMLDLPYKGILWDIGAGSGSISIEAARMNPLLSVYSVEKNKREIGNIENNIHRYQCMNVHLVAGEAPMVLDTLPKPDRIFIGGSGGNLEMIIEKSFHLIDSGKKIVITAVTETTKKYAAEFLLHRGFNVSSSLVSVTRINHQEKR